MTDSTNGGPPGGQPVTPPPAGDQASGQQLPQLNVLGQYVKDFSFENPNAPRSLAPTQEQPQLNIQINIGVQAIATTDFEVTLKLEGKAESKGSTLFAFDLTFCGVFRIQNIPQEHMQPMLMIECPRLLFPFAREIVATAVRNGGYAPLLLDPIDFVTLYHQRLQQQQQGQQPQFTMPT
jgi:preprotein translocase subunit SecB